MAPPAILAIPAEITEHALVHAHPRDVAHFAQTCRSARALVYEAHDQHLWRRLFLEQPFDDPRARSNANYATAALDRPGVLDDVDYKFELQKRVRLMRVIRNWRNDPDALDAFPALVRIARDAPVMPPPEQADKSRDLAWISSLLKVHSIWATDGDAEACLNLIASKYDGASSYAEPYFALESSSELWCLLGWRTSIVSSNAAELMRARTAARTFVYDMRNYTADNFYGPYKKDLRPIVNWKHIQNAIAIIQCNLMDLDRLWIDTRPPVDLDAIRAYSAPGSHTRDPRDWAGVQGTWRRYVCFMDYR